MKSILTAGLLVLGLAAASSASTAPARAGQDEQAELQQKYAEKLKKEFVGKIQWIQSFEQARASAKQEGKLVLGYFSRSYAP